MNTLNLVVALAVIALFAALAWAANFLFGPRHFFTAWMPGGGQARYRVKRWGDTFTWTNPADKHHQVVFPLDRTFARATKRGLDYIGDVATGLLLAWDHHKPGWLETDGRIVAAKLGDGREKNLASATNQSALGWLEPYVMPLLVAALAAICVIAFAMWKIYKGQQPPEPQDLEAAIVLPFLGLWS